MTTHAERIARHLEGLHHPSPGACPQCPDCNLDDTTDEALQAREEGGFSWSDCDACGSGLGGNRYPAHAWTKAKGGDLVHLEICTDCLAYLANGTEPEPDPGA